MSIISMVLVVVVAFLAGLEGILDQFQLPLHPMLLLHLSLLRLSWFLVVTLVLKESLWLKVWLFHLQSLVFS